jgi:predicted SAM-dependent methyltransferase
MPSISVLQRLRRLSRGRKEVRQEVESPDATRIADTSDDVARCEAVRIETARSFIQRIAVPYRLHFACGTVRLPGWINIDRDPASEIIDVSWDIRQPLPIADGSCEYIFHEHFLEHLTVAEGLAFLRECRRLLAPGGVLRVAMPDLAECVRQYYEDDWRQPWMKKYGYEWIQTRAETINIEFREWEHKWLYDREELHRRLRESGFATIRDCVRLESHVPALRGLETREESRLVCEAIKEISDG